MIVILARHDIARRIAREHGLTRRDWVLGSSGRSIRGLRGPIEVLLDPGWDGRHIAEVMDEIARINVRYPQPEVTP